MANLDFSGVKGIAIPEGDVIKIEASGTVIWKRGYTNQVQHSINADGTIYNDGLGYKAKTRVRSGGADGAQDYASCTGYIKVNPGDVIRLSGWAFDNAKAGNAINVSNASFTNIGQFTMQPASYGIFTGEDYGAYGYTSVVEERTGVWKWIVPPAGSGVAYIRASGYDSGAGVNGPCADMIVTINEEIED